MIRLSVVLHRSAARLKEVRKGGSFLRKRSCARTTATTLRETTCGCELLVCCETHQSLAVHAPSHLLKYQKQPARKYCRSLFVDQNHPAPPTTAVFQYTTPCSTRQACDQYGHGMLRTERNAYSASRWMPYGLRFRLLCLLCLFWCRGSVYGRQAPATVTTVVQKTDRYACLSLIVLR